MEVLIDVVAHYENRLLLRSIGPRSSDISSADQSIMVVLQTLILWDFLKIII
jgi:hypothetical protein